MERSKEESKVEPKEQSKGSVFVTRALSGVVFAAVMIGAILLSEYSFVALLLTICVGSMWEFYKIAKLGGSKPMVGFGVTMGAVVLLLSTLTTYAPLLGGTNVPYMDMILLVAVVSAVWMPFVIELYRKSDHPINNIATTIMGAVYVVLPVVLLFQISILGGAYIPWVVLCYIFIVWGNDVGAYLFGVTFGKHRLLERISPKKSWEGFFGGVLTALGVGVLSGYLLDQSILFWGGLSVVVAVSGVYGDLVESMFKRSVGEKDSGRMMPGHGGFLDRFDALILSAPFVYLYFTIFA